MKIAVIGLGQMGEHMAERILAAGHTLTVYNRTTTRAEGLRARGATVAATPGKAAAGAEVVVTMLTDDAAVEQVVFGTDGILPSLGSGVHVSMSSISVALAQRLVAAHTGRGQRYLSAPVFGRPEAAAAGKLFIVVGGDDSVINSVQPLFDVLGQRTYRAGPDATAANLFKLCGNFMLMSMVEAMAEAFALVRKAGIDPVVFKDIMTSSIFNAPAYHTYGDLLAAEKDDPPGYSLPLALKDVRLALAAADALQVPMPFASTIHDQFITAMARGYEARDQSVLGRIAAENAGIRDGSSKSR
jgi:3-hydroxyisobutyrate dehydrogenase-like beta-hydroxyacid dehydrogenase